MNSTPDRPRPAVSVIMPVYNSQKYLTESVASVLGQTWTDFELVLIDDGSDDDSPRLLADFASRDPRVVLLRHPRNLGQIPALNHGLGTAAGRYIARMDADDVCHPERLARQVAFLDAHPDVFLVGTDAIVIDAEGRTLGRLRCEPDPDRLARRLPYRNLLIHPTIMFRNDGRTRFREKMYFTEDCDLYLRLLSRGERLASLPQPLLRYRRHAASLSLKHLEHQMLFAAQAREFHQQRLRQGYDAYDAFDPQAILARDPDEATDERVLRHQVIAAFSVNALPETRKALRRYFRYHGVLRRPILLLYLVATGLPPGLLARGKRWVKTLIGRG